MRACLRGDLEREICSGERLVRSLDSAAVPAQPHTVPRGLAALAALHAAPCRVVAEAARREGHEELSRQALGPFELTRHRRDLHACICIEICMGICIGMRGHA